MNTPETSHSISYERLAARPVNKFATEYMVRMRDGTRLATDVYLPEGAAELGPTIIIRLPYDKNGEYTFIPDIATYMTRRGYRVVAQDVRGKFRSEGEAILWINEAYDGYDTIEWVVHQPWSDGVAGMWGDSYYGFTQLAAVSVAHPALRAIVPRLTGTRLGELPQPDGSPTTPVEMGISRIYPVTDFQSNDSYWWEMDWSSRPFAEVVERWFATIGERSPSYDLLTPHPVQLSRFPAGHPFDAPPVPMLQTIGWWDNCAPWQWADHELILTRPAWARNEFLLLEDIDHENNTFSSVPYDPADNPVTNVASRLAMLPRYLDPALEFFDVFLRGLGSPDAIPRVRWRVAGEPELRSGESWPPSGAQRLALYPARGGLHADPSPETNILEWTHDAGTPVPSPAANAFGFLREHPDERHLAERSDVLAFDAPATEDPLLLAGPIELQATIGSTAREMDLFARLTDVAPDGSVHLLARGQVTLHVVHELTTVRVDMGHTAYRLPEGHHLRLTLASSDFPEFLPAPGTGEDRWLAVATKPNRQSVVEGGDAGLSLAVTVLPDSDALPS